MHLFTVTYYDINFELVFERKLVLGIFSVRKWNSDIVWLYIRNSIELVILEIVI